MLLGVGPGEQFCGIVPKGGAFRVGMSVGGEVGLGERAVGEMEIDGVATEGDITDWEQATSKKSRLMVLMRVACPCAIEARDGRDFNIVIPLFSMSGVRPYLLLF